MQLVFLRRKLPCLTYPFTLPIRIAIFGFHIYVKLSETTRDLITPPTLMATSDVTPWHVRDPLAFDLLPELGSSETGDLIGVKLD